MLKDEIYKGADDSLIKFLATPCSYERILAACDSFDMATLLLDEKYLHNVEFNKLEQPARRDGRTVIDPRPFLSWWADREAARDPSFKAFRMRFFVSLLLMLAALAFFPDWLVLVIFITYWISLLLRK